MSKSAQELVIATTIVEYYKWQHGKMPTLIKPQEDPDMVCGVMDKVIEGSFRGNVVYGRGEYFKKSLPTIENSMRNNSNFREVPPLGSPSPVFRYVGKN